MAKKTPAQKPQVVSADDPRAAMVDDFLPLLEAVNAFKPTQKRYDEVRKKIQDLASAVAAKDEITLRGRTSQITLGPRAKERSIKSMAAVAKFFGDRFYGLCTLALKPCDSEMNAVERARYIDEDLTGSRPVISAGPRLP
jgi:hypothetical protein